MGTNIKAILFDLDGTLRDTKHVIYGALKEVFDTQGKPFPTDSELEPYINHSSFVREAFLPELDQTEFESIYYPAKDRLNPTAKVFQGTIESLTSLRERGFVLGLVTAARKSMLQLNELGLEDYFDVVISAEDSSEHKPNPEGLFVALERLCIPGTNAVYVGDMPTDIKAGKTANLRAAIGVSYGFFSRDKLEEAGADYVIDSLAELPGIVERLNNDED